MRLLVSASLLGIAIILFVNANTPSTAVFVDFEQQANAGASITAKQPSLKIMEQEMIALEQHIEQHMAEEKKSSSPPEISPTHVNKKSSSAVAKQVKPGTTNFEPYKTEEPGIQPNIDEPMIKKNKRIRTNAATLAMPESSEPSAGLRTNVPSHEKSSLSEVHVKKSSLYDDGNSSTPSLASMEREVIELEKQIQRHMTARENALVRVAAATSNCDANDTACGQAHDQINWKVSQDKYEQAAMKDILQEDHENSTEEGQQLFAQYASQADQLSGIQSLADLNKETNTLVHQHILAEHESLHALREAENQLDQIKKAQRAMREKKRAALDKAAISLAQKHMNSEVERMSGIHKLKATATRPVARKAKTPTPACHYDCDKDFDGQMHTDSYAQSSSAVVVPVVGPYSDSESASEATTRVISTRGTQRLSVSSAAGDHGASGVRPNDAAVYSLEAESSTYAPAAAPASELMTEQAYRHDIAQAKALEVLRQKAFLRMVQLQEAKVS